MTKLVYQPNHFSVDAVCMVLAPLWEQFTRDAPEFVALQESAHAMLFPFVPPDSFYDENGRIIANAPELIADTQRGHAYVAYLKPWVEGILSRGVVAQREFVITCGLTGEPIIAPPANDVSFSEQVDELEQDDETPTSEDPRLLITYPRAAQAIAVLNGLAQRYDSSSVQHAAVELAARTLQFIIDSGQEDPFMVFLEEGQKPCPPEKLARFGIV